MDTPSTAHTLPADSPGGSPDLFGHVVRALNVAYYEWYPGRDEIFISAALADMFGRDPGTWTRRQLDENVHPDDLPAFRAAMIAFFKSRADRATTEFRITRKDGTHRWVRNHDLVERDAAGQVTRLIGAVSDITAQRQHQAELERRDAENRALIARQQASIEVLKTISASPGDAAPVFDLIMRRARELCDAHTVSIMEYDGALIDLRSMDGFTQDASLAFKAAWPSPPTRQSAAGRAVLDRSIAHIADVDADPDLLQVIRNLGPKTLLGVPLLRDGAVIGVIILSRFAPGGFSDNEIALMQSFAEQAVIAIASATTLGALRERTADLQESLEYQTATSDVLKIISRTTFDLGPVLETLVVTAARLCDADMAFVLRRAGEEFRAAASVGFTPEYQAFLRTHPIIAGRGTVTGRVALEHRAIQIADVAADPEYTLTESTTLSGQRTALGVPLMREDTLIGVIVLSRRRVEPFTDRQIDLVRTFADQAVIAIENARLLGDLQARTAELAERNDAFAERIEHQAATIDVLKEMSASPGDPQPVFDLIVRQAQTLCGSQNASLFEYDGTMLHYRAWFFSSGWTEAREAYRRQFPRPMTRDPNLSVNTAILEGRIVHIRDADREPGVAAEARASGIRAGAVIPIFRDGAAVGAIAMTNHEPGGFSDTQIELLETFAEQAAIAITSAQTYRELQARTAELAERNDAFAERIDHQAATIDVLKAMSASPSDPQPVFDQIAERARAFCNAEFSGVLLRDGDLQHLAAVAGSDSFVQQMRGAFPSPVGPHSIGGRVFLSGEPVLINDTFADAAYSMQGVGTVQRSAAAVPVLRDGVAIGAIGIGYTTPSGFTETQVELLKTFAEQAAIAISSAETYRTLQDRTAALASSVEELQALENVLRAVNSSLDLDTVLETIIHRAVQLSQADEGTIYEFDAAEEVFVPKAAFGMTEDRVAALRARRIRLGETHLGRSAVLRAPVHVEDVQQDPSVPNAAEILPGIHAVLALPLLRDQKVIGGMVIRRRSETGFPPTIVTLMQTFAGQSVLAIENARLFQELAARGEEASRARAAAEAALGDLRRAKDQLVQSEKMASLGQLTAGIAHEIKNPLNFVNNFSDLSADLLDELSEALAPEKLDLPTDIRAEIDDLTAILKGNLQKITDHGKRADSIVKNMLLHSRSASTERRAMDVNAITEEALNLAYHGARAEIPGFNIMLEKDLDPAAGQAEMFPQELIRVLVNLAGNGFYAARKRAETAPDFEPALRLATRNLGDQVEIRVRDNGTGIPETIREKIFEPFFTTKPPGEGTGLGLSLSYDIIVKQHGGRLNVHSAADQFTEFVITLPRRPPGAGNPKEAPP